MIKPCAMCGTLITGARQKRFCSPCRKTRYRITIRFLAPGEKVPDHKPGRYSASHGYIRLRWKIGIKQYVETYEHRVINGYVTTEDHVHHLNHDRTDNRPENLRPLTAAEHAALHHEGMIRRTGRPSHNKGVTIIKPWHREAESLYVEGLSTGQIGKRLNRDSASVYRCLVKLGVPLRKEARIAIPNRERNHG